MSARGDRNTLYHDPDAPVQPFQQAWEFAQVLRLLEQSWFRNVLEIGTYHGGSLYQFMKHTCPAGAGFISIDTEVRLSQKEADEWANEFGHTVKLIVGDSADPYVVNSVKKQMPTVDFLLIDGNHGYDSVRHDWENYAPLVQEGIIVMHDIVNPLPGCDVPAFWQELRQSGPIVQELMASPEQGEFGTGIVYRGSFSWML